MGKSEVGKNRVKQLFQYLEAFNQQRNPVICQIKDQEWSLFLKKLPEHPSIGKGNLQDQAEQFVLKISRPKLESPPLPPVEIKDWILTGWDDCYTEASFVEVDTTIDRDGNEIKIYLKDDPKRVTLLNRWHTERDDWARREKPARDAYKVFERVYALYSLIEREAGLLELVLGDGILSWRLPTGTIHHPILLQRLQLSFNPKVPEFIFQETSHPVELYTALLRTNPKIDPKIIAQIRSEIEQREFHPLESETTSEFFKEFVQQLASDGQFISDGEIKGESDSPKLARDPVIFLRKGSLGFTNAIESILEEISELDAGKIPAALLNIVGGQESIGATQNSSTVRLDGGGNEDEEILFNKHANPEQLLIAKNLDRNGCVVVQGPPGTGKTHTIANLLGHLLAKGQSVLVTSHTTQALKTLRDKVDPSIQSLCVSVLESDSESQQQMSSSIREIAERLNNDALTFERSAAELRKQRNEIITKLKEMRQKLYHARADEYRDLSVRGKTYAPSEAARIVQEGKGIDDWIPEPILLGNSLPLSEEDIAELYSTNRSVSLNDETDLALSLPAPELVLPTHDFAKMVQQYRELNGIEIRDRADLWEPLTMLSSESPETILAKTQQAMMPIIQGLNDPLKLALINDGRRDETYRKPWDDLIEKINQVVKTASGSLTLMLEYEPQLAPDISIDQQLKALDEITDHLDKGSGLGRLTLLMHSEWKAVIKKCLVDGKRPTAPIHFQALKESAKLELQRNNLITRWDRQVAPLGAPLAKNFGKQAEESCQQFVPLMQSLLNWYKETWLPIERKLKDTSFRWEKLLQEIPLNPQSNGELLKLVDAAQNHLPTIFKARITLLRRNEIRRELSNYKSRIRTQPSANQTGSLLAELLRAVESLDIDLYQQISDRINDLHQRHQSYIKRRELLTRLEKVAPGWSRAIHQRLSPHSNDFPPGDVLKAWLWRELHEEIAEIGRVSIEDIQANIDKLVSNLHQVTSGLIEASSWAHQIRRTGSEQKQALIGWINTMKKIGAGTGQRVPQLRVAARKQMESCRPAVPVWIMPMSRVVESYKPTKGLFDVVIIDESSQCDVTGLIALYLGKKVIVVGDDEQVSPDAVGQKVVASQSLIDTYLQGIPNSVLYDGKLSIYDLAMQSFNGSVCLLEHFRCVPEIIQFSNTLSYKGKIKPLRDSTHSKLLPAVISQYVPAGFSDSKVNKNEAITVASLVVAAIEQPEYAKQTFGIISLIGEGKRNPQATFIETILKDKLSATEFKSRKIRCGNASNFQGDERDVIFLSVVDSPSEFCTPLSMRREDRFRKRFNVAASRAKNQLWVVHSLQAENDLQDGDLRYRLIKYAQNPKADLEAHEGKLIKVESEFEGQVMKKLLTANYHTTPQWKVGSYRIDMVISGKNQKLALECDGDRWHPVEKIPEDMERQAILERVGWKFVRIRGSEFFKDPDKAMEKVFTKLENLGIEPVKPDEVKEQQGSELSTRIIRRAEELRKEWHDTNIGSIEIEKEPEDKELEETITL